MRPLRIVVALLLLGGTAAAEGPKRVLLVTHAGGYMHDRRVPGQLGTLAYQPTPQGLEEMKTAGDYAHAAANIERMELASGKVNHSPAFSSSRCFAASDAIR